MKKVLAPLALAALVFAGCNTQTSSSKGKDGKEFELKMPASVSVNQGETAELKVSVERKGFDEPVTVKFEKLPDGVTIEEDGKFDKGVKEKTFTVKAKADAKVGKHTIKVSSTHADMSPNKEVTIEVKEKKASTSGSSPVGKQAGEDLKRKRDELNTTAQARLKDIDKSMDDLRAEAKTADAKAKVEINSRLSALEDQRKKLGNQVAEIQTTSADAWEAFSARLTTAADELHKGVNEAVTKFKKK